MNIEKRLSLSIARKFLITISLQLKQNKNAKFYRENYGRQQQDFREVHQQNLTEMKELQKFQNSTFDELTRQKFIEDQNTIMELSGRLQELQNEVNCMNDSIVIFRMLSRCAVEIHTLPVNQEYSLNILLLKRLLRPSFVSPRHTTDGPPKYLGYIRYNQETFLHTPTSFPLQLRILKN